MNYPQYKKDLQRIHESEVYGKAVFEMAARITSDDQRKRKWLALKALEEKTLDRYIAYMKDSGQPISEPVGWGFKGSIEGFVLALLPWRFSMKLLRKGTKPFQINFLRLKNNAESAHQEFFVYVYAHEKAIEAFAQRELSGEENSLAPIDKLLAS